MTHPSIHARTHPDKIAYQMAGTGKAISYRELDALSNQGAHLFRKLGLKAADHIALLMENRPDFLCCWLGMFKAGLSVALINTNQRGQALAHSIEISRARHVIVGSVLLDDVLYKALELPRGRSGATFLL